MKKNHLISNDNHKNSSFFSIAWIGSLGYGLCLTCGLLTSNITERISARFVMVSGAFLAVLGFLASSFMANAHGLFFSYSLLTSLGMSGLFFSSILVLPLYFKKRLMMANGIATSGCGIGCLAISSGLEYLIRTMGLRKTFQIYAGMAALSIFGGLIITRKPNKKFKPFGLKSLINTHVLRNKAYLLFCLAIAMVLLGYYVPFVHLVSYDVEGLSVHNRAKYERE